MSKERLGILGGTFNPIHAGHLAMARCALKQASLDRVIFLPDGMPPHKTGIASAKDRYIMISVAICQDEHFEVSRMELDRTGTTYTFDTLTELHRSHPKAELFYIIGTDTLMALHTWHRSDEVLPLCTFLVAPRETDYTPEEIQAEKKRLKKKGAHFIMLDMPLEPTSSTSVREKLAATGTGLGLPAVEEYCSLRGLYGMPMRIFQAEQWLDQLYQDLNIRRFAHTLGVCYAARELARLHRTDALKAETAALLHDCAKCMPLKDMQTMCREYALTADIQTMSSGNLLHSVAGAYLAATKYGIQDPDILRAISCHTTGKIGMTRLDMIVYLADKIEPGRAGYPSLEAVRAAARVSLEKAMLLSLEGTASYVRSGSKPLHPQSLRTIEWLKSLPETTNPQQAIKEVPS